MARTKIKIDQDDLIEALGGDLNVWSHQCHAASIHLVKSGVFPASLGARVGRGSCTGVGGQHSWVVLGGNCYDDRAHVIDPTLWSYDASVSGIWTGRANQRPHIPHGAGSIFEWGKPASYGGEPVDLGATGLSEWAKSFLVMLGPLDRRGWMSLFSHAPVGGWPAGEIIAAAYRNPELQALIPIDRVGMLTDLNPQGLYLAGTPGT